MNEKQGGGELVGVGGLVWYELMVFKWVPVVEYCLYVYYYLNIVNGLLEEEDDESSDKKTFQKKKEERR